MCILAFFSHHKQYNYTIKSTCASICIIYLNNLLSQCSFPRVLIDGPYGAPTQDYKSYDVVLLVGLGIGATPMISVVKDIVNNMKAMDEEGNALEEGASGPSSLTTPKRSSAAGSGRHNFRTRRAYFYWVTREQGSFDWFKNVMNEVAEMDHKGVIEMHNYCTSVYEEGDARSALITMLQSLNHAKNGVDVVSGTRVKSHFAKPNWRTVYKRIALNHPNSRVGEFLRCELAPSNRPSATFLRVIYSFSNDCWDNNTYDICRCVLLWGTTTSEGAKTAGV